MRVHDSARGAEEFGRSSYCSLSQKMSTRLWHIVQERPMLFLLAGAVPVVECIAAVQGGPGPSIAVVRNPFAAIAVASLFCRYIFADRRGPTRRWIVYLTPLTFAVPLAVEGSHAPMPLLFLDMMFGVGVLGVCGFVVAAIVASDSEGKWRYTEQLMDALLLPLAASMVSFGLWSTYRINPVYDGRIRAFEEILGVKLSLLAVRSYPQLRPFSGIATVCYITLGFAMTVVAAAQGSARRERDFLTATVAAGACGFALYFACPVVGTLQAFAPMFPGALPLVPLDAPLMTAAIGAPRNGMPSLHAIWALLIWFNLESLPAGLKGALRAFVILTLWAAMGPDGAHWLMDVVVGVPLAVAVQSAFVSSRSGAPRHTWTTVTICVALAAGWILAFRLGAPILDMPAGLAWMAVVITVCWPLSRQRGTVERIGVLRDHAGLKVPPYVAPVATETTRA